jgi:hypothetical protein
MKLRLVVRIVNLPVLSLAPVVPQIGAKKKAASDGGLLHWSADLHCSIVIPRPQAEGSFL